MTTDSSQEAGQVTGTPDKDYNLIWFTEQCLSNALRLGTYVQDANRDGDSELAELFRKAQADSRKGAEQGKQLLKARRSGGLSQSDETDPGRRCDGASGVRGVTRHARLPPRWQA